MLCYDHGHLKSVEACILYKIIKNSTNYQVQMKSSVEPRSWKSSKSVTWAVPAIGAWRST